MLKGIGTTVSSSVSGRDISLDYYDTETRLEVLETRQERLMALLEEAATLEDIIELERELADVDYEISIYEGTLRDYDSLIDYSTITITLEEVNEITEVATSDDQTIGERISSGFYSVLSVLAEFGEGLLVFIIAGSPALIILAAIILLIVWLVKRSNRKHLKKQAENRGNLPNGSDRQ